VVNFEHFERGYLLPKGCSDLMDVINLLQTRPKPEIWLKPGSTCSHKAPPSKPFFSWDPTQKGSTPSHQPTKGELWVSEHITVSELASLLKLKPFTIIGDLMELGFFASLNQQLSFKAVSQISQKYGYVARKSA
jgi:Translation initiation factor IF-2, N-terminal region